MRQSCAYRRDVVIRIKPATRVEARRQTTASRCRYKHNATQNLNSPSMLPARNFSAGKSPPKHFAKTS
jgi:hypothetical protein